MGEFEYSAEHKQKIAITPKPLTYAETYRCPVCESGDLSAIALMDAFACSFCRHIFTANLQTQSVQLSDSLQPMAWRWNGLRWRTAQQSGTADYLIWLFSGGLTAAPVVLIALSNYVFPPLESTDFPLMWTALTLMSHGAMSSWLLAEYHRWPWYVAGTIRLQRLRERLFADD